MPDLTYHNARDIKNIEQLRQMLPEMPSFCTEFFRGITPETTPLTRINYARDLVIFFDFLRNYKTSCKDKSTNAELTTQDMASVTMTDIETYLDYLTVYNRNDKLLQDDEAAKERKLSSLRTLFKYLFKKQYISSNVAALIDMPKRHEREIIRLEVDEVAKLLDMVDEGTNLTKKQAEYHKINRLRDLALISLLLGTGIRVSECVGLDINDVDFEVNGFVVTRKGGQRVVLYFSDEVADVLREYIDWRKTAETQPGHENALFLSTRKRRLDVRSVQVLVKKYASVVTPLKHITPHKLRSTFGTNLYAETGDIYLVADVLGHSDVNTTRRHYAAQSDENRRKAAHSVKLRDDPDIPQK